jgi:hypothetical protein
LNHMFRLVDRARRGAFPGMGNQLVILTGSYGWDGRAKDLVVGFGKRA